MLKLVEKLPFMICPHWTQRPTQTIDIKDVVDSLVYCLNNETTFDKSFDMGSTGKLSYIDMMRITSELLGL